MGPNDVTEAKKGLHDCLKTEMGVILAKSSKNIDINALFLKKIVWMLAKNMRKIYT